MHLSTRTTAALAAATGALVLATTGAAGAASSSSGGAAAGAAHPWSRTLNDTVLAPFQIALNRGHVYYTDGFAGTVSRVRPGDDEVVASVQGEIAGVELTPDGRTMAYAASTQAGTSLTIRRAGRPDVVADLSGYEDAANPDGHRTYGVQGPASQCAKDFFAQVSGGPATYTGIKESHPYQVAYLGRGSWAVADAAGNDVLRVRPDGRVSTLAVLPKQPVRITRAMATELGAPDCVVGVTYAFEPVPTDVERDQHGDLWVSTLPGGPEDGSLGKRGSVYRISPDGAVRRFATGFLSATNLAVTPGGTLYVTELFGGQVTQVFRHHKTAKLTLERPVSVEVLGRSLYVGQLADADPETGEVHAPGSIQVFRR